ncbi:Clp protease N-terminal domain-containing protein [Spirillospora sp. CA-294931]|uniref:Clp protease N-terminal domain-containing protein n=1 Tax=Spirillospora sp. CA-294931 TaxID=3240042 RepID=UPI003D8CF024
MVENSARKNAIRAHMAKTGKTYTDAARDLARPHITLEGFNVPAQDVLDLARTHARSNGHHEVGTEHLLLALLDEEAPVELAFDILDDLGVTTEAVKSALPNPQRPTPHELPWSDHTAQVLAKGAARQGDRTGHGYIGPEHILLALLALPTCRAHQILTDLGLTYKTVKTEVVDRLNAMGVVSRYNQG